MTLFLFGLTVGATLGAALGWVACSGWYRAFHSDRQLREEAAHLKGDAIWMLEHQLDRRHASLRYLARLPQPRRVRVMSRYCTMLRREMTV